MSVFLLDVNVLVALLWGDHEAHKRVETWFARNASRGWATCPFTQVAFVRIASNPSFSPYAVSPSEAIALLGRITKYPEHHFWKDDLTLLEAVAAFHGKLVGHQQVTDAYLLGLAIHKNGKLATLDQSISALLGTNAPGRGHIELIRDSS